MESNPDDSMEDELEVGLSGKGKGLGNEMMATPIAAFHPDLGHFTMVGNSDLMTQVIQEMDMNKEHYDQIANIGGEQGCPRIGKQSC